MGVMTQKKLIETVIFVLKYSNMAKRKFLVTISTEVGKFNESEFSVKEAVENALENEVQDNFESPLYNCSFSIKEVTE